MDSFPQKVLIVEDNALQRLAMKRRVEDMDLEVVAGVDKGEKAIVKASQLKPDLILMDVFLNGDMTGIQAMETIQKKAQIPVIYISGNSDSYYRKKALQTNHAQFIFKPVSRNELAQAIETAFNDIELKDAKKWPWPFNLFLP